MIEEVPLIFQEKSFNLNQELDPGSDEIYFLHIPVRGNINISREDCLFPLGTKP